jgi:hypothetical protein
MYGSAIDEAKIAKARSVLVMMLEKGNFHVLNPFAPDIEQKDYTVLNRRPMLHSLLSCITYANRWMRPQFARGEDAFLIATLSDVLEALNIWHKNEAAMRTGLPERYLKVLQVFGPDDHFTKFEAADVYKSKHGSVITPGTIYGYMHDLEEKGHLASRKDGQDPRELSYYLPTMSSNSSISILDIRKSTPEQLAERLKSILGPSLASFRGKQQLTAEDALKVVLDAEFPAHTEQGKLG